MSSEYSNSSNNTTISTNHSFSSDNISMSSVLNPSQQKAMKHIDGPLLILAGAGSGKTNTITHRLAYLIDIGIDPASILCLTFTNKAAKQMRTRAFGLIDSSMMSRVPLLCTFHKFGLLFLKFHISVLNRKNSFTIIDSDDKRKILRSIDKEISTALVSSEISIYKNSILCVEDVAKNVQTKLDRQICDIYEKYENYLLANNLVDFDDLILLSYKILSSNKKIAIETSKKYQYIMVDEYQDTNELQYRLLGLLCSEHNNLCVVGDDDQSIYGWRGANINNILNFSSNFKDTLVIKLEENYRSTNTILEHANNLISYNKNRLGKRLIGTRGDGKSIKVYESVDESIETAKIIKDIKSLISLGISADDIAILFRVNALSRSLEEGFNKEGIGYKLVGGMKFYERAEIKDLIAYFRLISNHSDDFSFKRVVNKPKRGIGKSSIEKLELAAISRGVTIFGFILDSTLEQLSTIVSKKAANTLKIFVSSILDLKDVLNESKMLFINHFEDTFDFRLSFDKLPDGFERQANIDEFYGYLRDYFLSNDSLGLDDFLNEVSLSSEDESMSGEYVSMMSIHSSKGLEYKYIFTIGLEEGFFPIISDGVDIEEERRLGYVCMTRAMDELVFSFVHSRFYKGKRTSLVKSRFLVESGLIEGSLRLENSSLYKKNDLIKHKIFGIGKVEKVVKLSQDVKLTINFGGSRRQILSSFVTKI